MAKCPMCSAKVGRRQMMCGECGFALPASSGPILGPPPGPGVSARTPAAAPLPVTAAMPGDSSSTALYETRLPSTREAKKVLGLIFMFFFVASFLAGGGLDDLLIFVAFMAAYGIRAAFSLFGWEGVAVFDDRLVIERTLWGARLRRLDIPKERLEDIRFESKAPTGWAFGGNEDRGALWSFSRGPVLIVHNDGTYRFGEGLEGDDDAIGELADRLRAELIGA